MRTVRTRGYADRMKNTFRIVPLPTETADAARRSASNGAPAHQIVVADARGSAPCRHCLRWAEPGERMILFPFQSIPADRPWTESGPIYVHQEPCERYAATDEFPAAFREGRVLRQYDAQDELTGAEVVDGDPATAIERLLGDDNVAFVQVRSVTHGCYTMRVERA